MTSGFYFYPNCNTLAGKTKLKVFEGELFEKSSPSINYP
jgi:hypothetical protein